MPTTRPRAASCACGSVVLHVNVSALQTVHRHCRAVAGRRAPRLAPGGACRWPRRISRSGRRFLPASLAGVREPQPRANRYFCSKCGCSVAMTYPATGRWPEPHSLWLSAAFLGDDDAGINVIHMCPEERPGWVDIDRQGCDDQPLSYMGDDHVCETSGRRRGPRVRARPGGHRGRAAARSSSRRRRSCSLHLSVSDCEVSPRRLRSSRAAPRWRWRLPPDWARSGREMTTVEATVADDFRVRTIDVAGTTVSIFEVADPTSDDGCDADSPRSAMCGGVLWPGSRAAAEALAELSLAGRTVVEIGAGTGLCSLAAASLGGDGSGCHGRFARECSS